MEPPEKLKENLNREIKLHPNYPDLVNMLGLLLTLEGNHSEALEQYEHALGINPKYLECRANRAWSLAALGRVEEGLEAAAAVVREAPGSYTALVTCGKLLAWQGKIDSARPALEKAAALKPNCPATYHYLGLAFLAEGKQKWQKACENFDKAAGLGTAYIALYDSLHIYRKGRIKLTSADKQAAQSLLAQLADNPNTVKVYLSEAKMFASGSFFDDATSRFEKARAIEPDSPEIENSLGLVAQAREYGEEAKLHFRRALQFDPANITAHLNLAFQLGADGDLTGAEEQMRTCVEFAPRYPDLRVQLATILTERGELDEAISHLREALSINPKYIFAAFMLASILFTKKRYQEVIETYSEFDVESAGLPEAYSHLATSYLETGQAETAIETAKKAISSENALPSSYVCLAIAYRRLKKNKEAIACAKEYIRQFPEGPEIDEMRKLTGRPGNTTAQ